MLTVLTFGVFVFDFLIVAIMSGISFSFLLSFLQLIGDGDVAGCVEAKEEESVLFKKRQELVCYFYNF